MVEIKEQIMFLKLKGYKDILVEESECVLFLPNLKWKIKYKCYRVKNGRVATYRVGTVMRTSTLLNILSG